MVSSLYFFNTKISDIICYKWHSIYLMMGKNKHQWNFKNNLFQLKYIISSPCSRATRCHIESQIQILCPFLSLGCCYRLPLPLISCPFNTNFVPSFNLALFLHCGTHSNAINFTMHQCFEPQIDFTPKYLQPKIASPLNLRHQTTSSHKLHHSLHP